MAIKIYEKFAPRANPADGDYPYGSIKNESAPGAKDGTPLDAAWANDYAGFDAELFAQAGVVPSGQPDKLGASQRVDAIKQLEKAASRVTKVGGGSVQDFIDAQYTTAAELATGKFKVGTYVRLTDRAFRLFLLKSGGVADGYGILNAGNGNAAVYADEIIDAAGFGAKGYPSDDTVAFQKATIAAGDKGVYVPYNSSGYVVLDDIQNLWGHGPISFHGTGFLCYYTDVSDSVAHTTAAQIAKRLSDLDPVVFATFGDSTMFGYQVGGANPQVQDPNAPPISLANMLGTLFGSVHSVIDISYSGSNLQETMRGSSETVPHLIKFEKRISAGGDAETADVIFCNHGINNTQSNLSIDTFKKDLTEFVRVVRKHGKLPVLVTPTPMTPVVFGDAARKSEQLPMYVQVVRDVAKATACDLVDWYHYTKQTAKYVKEIDIIPDGVHGSSQQYLQCGRNLLIPFVAANHIDKEGDIASPSGAHMRITPSTVVTAQPQTLTGVSYTATRDDLVYNGISQSVVCDSYLQYIAYNALRWSGGAQVLLGEYGTPDRFATVKFHIDYGSNPNADWGSPFVVNANLWAGLHQLYCVFDITNSDPVKKQMAFNGISVPAQTSKTYVNPITFENSNVGAINSKQAFFTNFNFMTAGQKLKLVDVSGATCLSLYLNSSNDLIAELIGGGSVVDSANMGALSAATWAVDIRIGHDALTIKLPSKTQTFALTSAFPPVKPEYVGLVYSVVPI